MKNGGDKTGKKVMASSLQRSCDNFPEIRFERHLPISQPDRKAMAFGLSHPGGNHWWRYGLRTIYYLGLGFCVSALVLLILFPVLVLAHFFMWFERWIRGETKHESNLLLRPIRERLPEHNAAHQ